MNKKLYVEIHCKNVFLLLKREKIVILMYMRILSDTLINIKTKLRREIRSKLRKENVNKCY